MAEEKQGTSNQNRLIEWKVTRNLLQQFKKAKHKQVFYSPQFKTIDGTVWRIQFCPHGWVSPANCTIYLECVRLKADKKQIGVNYSFDFTELNWCYDGGNTFRYDGEARGLSKAFKAEKLNTLSVLNIKCFVEETMDVSECNTYYEWKINKHWMHQWKQAKYKKAFYSPKFNAIGAEWKLGICPNGWNTKGIADLYILCKAIDSVVKEVNVCHYIEIDALDHSQMYFDGNKMKRDGSVTCNSPFKWNEIQKLSAITIGIKIWKTASIPKNEARLLSNIYSEKMVKLHKEYSKSIHHLRQENEELREDIEKKANLIKDTALNLNSTITALKRDNQAMEEKLKKFAMRELCNFEDKQKKEEQIVKLEKENETLKKVAMTEIRTFDAEQEIVIPHDKMKKQKQFEDKMEIDEKRLNEWKLDTISIGNALGGSEEKENNETNTDSLLDRFVQCKTLCDKQQIRMENVMTHCTKLNKIKKILKKESTQCDEKANKMEREYLDWNEKYQKIQNNRPKLQMQWMNALRKMNETIAEENQTNDAKCSAQNQYNASSLEGKQWNVLYTKCTKLIKEYQLFDDQNESNLHKAKQMFDELWNQFMQEWFEWQPRDIICWFKYLQIQNELMLSNEFDFECVLNEMVKSKMNGLSFTSIDKSDLKTIGVTTLNDRQQIYHKINTLMAKYPHQNTNASETVEGHCEMNNIPNEFICPLTKKIMREPVKIFDNNTYEKEAIEKYLKHYNKSPVTGEQCDDEDDHWALSNRKLKEKIKIFLSVNQISFDKNPFKNGSDDSKSTSNELSDNNPFNKIE
eukprot:802897_1